MNNDLDTRMGTLKHTLEQWERSLGLPEIIIDVSVLDELLNLSKDRLHLMTAMEVGEHAFELARFALHIQRKENQCTAFLNWAASIKSTIFNDDKTKLHQLIRGASIKKDRIAYLFRRIEFMSVCLNTLQRTKYREENQ